MQLIDSSERADTLLSKRTGVGFEPVTSLLRTRGNNHYSIAARIAHSDVIKGAHPAYGPGANEPVSLPRM